MTRSITRAGACGGAVLLALLLAVTACSGSQTKPSAARSSSPSPYRPSSGATDSSSPSGDVSASPSPSLPPDPVVKTYRRVLRNGKVPRPTVSARPAAFSGTVRYTDGLKLDVTGVDQAKVTDQGPGEFPGEPKTQISLRMTNGGEASVNLNQVVVTAIYGSAGRQARPVYDARSRDFSGVLKPASSSTAVYSFSVPKADLGKLTMLVDFDARHTVATFDGDPRSAG